MLSEEAAYLMSNAGDALALTLQRAKHPAAALFGADVPSAAGGGSSSGQSSEDLRDRRGPRM